MRPDREISKDANTGEQHFCLSIYIEPRLLFKSNKRLSFALQNTVAETKRELIYQMMGMRSNKAFPPTIEHLALSQPVRKGMTRTTNMNVLIKYGTHVPVCTDTS